MLRIITLVVLLSASLMASGHAQEDCVDSVVRDKLDVILEKLEDQDHRIDDLFVKIEEILAQQQAEVESKEKVLREIQK